MFASLALIWCLILSGEELETSISVSKTHSEVFPQYDSIPGIEAILQAQQAYFGIDLYNTPDEDSLYLMEERLDSCILTFLRQAESFDYVMDELISDRLAIDAHYDLRVYSWEKHQLSSAHPFRSILQWRTPEGKVYATPLSDGMQWTAIYPLPDSSLYALVGSMTTCHTCSAEALKVIRLDQNQLVPSNSFDMFSDQPAYTVTDGQFSIDYRLQNGLDFHYDPKTGLFHYRYFIESEEESDLKDTLLDVRGQLMYEARRFKELNYSITPISQITVDSLLNY